MAFQHYKKPWGLADGSRIVVSMYSPNNEVMNDFDFITKNGRWICSNRFIYPSDRNVQLDPEGYLCFTKDGVRTDERYRCSIVWMCYHRKIVCRQCAQNTVKYL